MVNIIVFDIIFLDIKDALVNVTLYFLMLLFILFFNKDKIIVAFQALTNQPPQKVLTNHYSFRNIGIILLLMVLVFGIDQFFVTLVRSYSL